MAVRMDADGEDYTRTLTLGTQAALTVSGWFRRAVDRGNYSTIFSVDNGTGDNWLMQTGVDGDTMNTVFDATTQQSMGVMTLGTWYFICLSTNGTTGNIFYRTAAQNALTTVAVSGATASVNAATLRIGESPWGGEWWNGDCANVCMWLASLTATEVYNESVRYVPYRYANLAGWYPFLKPETTDYSGNGRTLSGGVGTTVSDGPPIPWFPAAPRLVLPAAGGGGSPINVALGRATETGTSNALARAKNIALGRSLATGTAQALARSKNVPLTRSASTDLSRLLTPSKLVSFQRSTEADVARPIARSKTVNFPRVTEADIAKSLTASHSVSLGKVLSADVARSLTKSSLWYLGKVTSTESTRSLSVAHNVLLGRSLELDIVRNIGPSGVIQVALGRATSTSLVRALTPAKSIVLGRTLSVSAARALAATHQLVLGRAVETSVVRALSASHAVLLSRTVETSLACTLTLRKIVQLVQAIETGTVRSVAPLESGGGVDVGDGGTLLVVDVDYGTQVEVVRASSGLLVVMIAVDPGERI